MNDVMKARVKLAGGKQMAGWLGRAGSRAERDTTFRVEDGMEGTLVMKGKSVALEISGASFEE